MGRAEVLDRLFDVIESRRRDRPAGSYVAALLTEGLPAIAAKVREEGEEVIEAATAADRTGIAQEVADLLFHTWVLMAHGDVRPEQVYAVLEDRFGIGGLVEKASRESRDAD
jgi:phosphoribosyl-ATP pyrophosphohydrolase